MDQRQRGASATLDIHVSGCYILPMYFPSALLRRLTASALALSFGLYTAEALLADTHDGDATHEELARVDGAGEHVQFHVSHGDAPDAVRAGAQADDPDQHPGERAPGQSGHEQHACHCMHMHGGWLQDRPTFVAALGVNHAGPAAFVDDAPTSRSSEPQLRPPIA